MPKIRARYQVVGPQKVKRQVVKVSYNSETKIRELKVVEVEEDMWMVYFPQGHSIRVNKAGLIEHKFNLKPRLVDLETGDIIDTGGDPFDLTQPIERFDVELGEDDISLPMIEVNPNSNADNSASTSKQKGTN